MVGNRKSVSHGPTSEWPAYDCKSEEGSAIPITIALLQDDGAAYGFDFFSNTYLFWVFVSSLNEYAGIGGSYAS